jgi:hypothetical protein
MRIVIIRLSVIFISEGIMRIAVLPALGLLLFVTAAVAADAPQFSLTIRDHRFTPAEIRVPANVKVRLVVDNQDAAPEEFDSHALNREKVIPGKSKATIFIGPLAPGRYPFIGEFNAATAQGVVIAE